MALTVDWREGIVSSVDCYDRYGDLMNILAGRVGALGVFLVSKHVNYARVVQFLKVPGLDK